MGWAHAFFAQVKNASGHLRKALFFEVGSVVGDLLPVFPRKGCRAGLKREILASGSFRNSIASVNFAIFRSAAPPFTRRA